MSQIKAKFVAVDPVFWIKDREIIEYNPLFLKGIFNTINPELADNCHQFGLCLKEKLEQVLAQHRCLCADYPNTALDLQVYTNQEKSLAKELLVGSI
ncbi:hypothetical protein [Pleurocapsa sp. PCC 7319]|uniref:hypothetical protein n=1 Tax=Pleurocapsa sp. PCC 7319 TaxID=118161 RepID=UPI0004783976|nr:hypothetical protein [Pleurocapsa sp. PCC 7319]